VELEGVGSVPFSSYGPEMGCPDLTRVHMHAVDLRYTGHLIVEKWQDPDRRSFPYGPSDLGHVALSRS
jgi:hypothetical protein